MSVKMQARKIGWMLSASYPQLQMINLFGKQMKLEKEMREGLITVSAFDPSRNAASAR